MYVCVQLAKTQIFYCVSDLSSSVVNFTVLRLLNCAYLPMAMVAKQVGDMNMTAFYLNIYLYMYVYSSVDLNKCYSAIHLTNSSHRLESSTSTYLSLPLFSREIAEAIEKDFFQQINR